MYSVLQNVLVWASATHDLCAMLSPQGQRHSLHWQRHHKGGGRDICSSLQKLLEIGLLHKLTTRLICRVSRATTMEWNSMDAARGCCYDKTNEDEIFDSNNLINDKICMLLQYLRIPEGRIHPTYNFCHRIIDMAAGRA